MIIFKNEWRYEIENINYTKGCEAYISGLPEDCYPAEPSEIEFDLVSIARDDEAANYCDVLDSDELEDFVLESYESEDYI